MRSSTIRLIACAVLSAIAIACTAQAPTPTVKSSPVTAIKLCSSSTSSSTQVVIWYAYEKGLFKKYGLEPTLVFSKSGSDAATALITKAVDVCQISGPAVVNAAIAGEDLIFIGGPFNTYIYSLAVTPDIKTPQDLKGKALAISEPGSSSDAALRALLKTQNLNPDNDVTILSIGSQGARLAAMAAGQVAGTLVSGAETVEAREEGFNVLLDMSNSGIAYPQSSIVTSKTYLDQHRDIAVNVMKAIGEAIAQMKQDKPSTLEVMAKYLKLDIEQDAPSLNEAYDVLVQKYLLKVPYPSVDGVKTVLTQVEAENPQAAKVKPEDVVDASIVQDLESSGFFKGLYP